MNHTDARRPSSIPHGSHKSATEDLTEDLPGRRTCTSHPALTSLGSSTPAFPRGGRPLRRSTHQLIESNSNARHAALSRPTQMSTPMPPPTAPSGQAGSE
eukprot:788268-Prymnesium_polylepis.1